MKKWIEPWIKYLRRHEIVHTPEKLRNKVEKAKDAYYKETGCRILNQDLAELLKKSEIKLNDLERAAYPELFPSLDEDVFEDFDGPITRSATIEDAKFIDPLDRLEFKEELGIKLSKTRDVRKIAILKEELAKLEFELNSGDDDKRCSFSS